MKLRRSSRIAAIQEKQDSTSTTGMVVDGSKRAAVKRATPTSAAAKKRSVNAKTTKKVLAAAKSPAKKVPLTKKAPTRSGTKRARATSNASKAKEPPAKRSRATAKTAKKVPTKTRGARSSSAGAKARATKKVTNNVNHIARIGDVCFALGILPHLELADVLAVASVDQALHNSLSKSAMVWSNLRHRLLDAEECDEHSKKAVGDRLIPSDEQVALSAKLVLRAHIQPSALDSDDAVCKCVLRDAKTTFVELHEAHCRRHNQETTPAQRRAEIIEALGEFGQSLRGDSKLCQGYISGTLYDLKSAYECAAQMALTGYLMGKSHIIWSNFHDQFDIALRDIKFSKNLDWGAAKKAVVAKYQGSVNNYVPVSFGRGGRGGECWTCGEWGHFSYECDENYGGYGYRRRRGPWDSDDYSGGEWDDWY